MPAANPVEKHKEHVVLGMSAAMGAFLMFTIMNVLAKLLSERHSVIEISFYRNAVALIPFLIMIFAMGRRDVLVIRHKPGWVIFRAVFGTVSLSTTFAAYALMPMANTTALLFTTSLFIPVLGIIFLKEHVGAYRWTAILVGFVGVIVMVRPSGHLYALGISLALGAAFLQAILQVALLLGVGLSGAAAQWLFSTAFRNAPAAIVTIFNYSGIVWATLFGWLIWNEWPLPMVLGGAAVVIVSNVLIIWRESRVRTITGDRIRAKL